MSSAFDNAENSVAGVSWVCGWPSQHRQLVDGNNCISLSWWGRHISGTVQSTRR